MALLGETDGQTVYIIGPMEQEVANDVMSFVYNIDPSRWKAVRGLSINGYIKAKLRLGQ